MQRRNGGSGDNIKTDLLENTIKMSREAGSCMMIGVCVCAVRRVRRTAKRDY